MLDMIADFFDRYETLLITIQRIAALAVLLGAIAAVMPT